MVNEILAVDIWSPADSITLTSRKCCSKYEILNMSKWGDISKSVDVKDIRQVTEELRIEKLGGMT